MLQHLLESNAQVQRRVGGSLASTIAHAALIAGAIALTTTQRAPAEVAPVKPLTFINVAPKAPAPPLHTNRASSAPSSSSTTPTNPTPTLTVPTISVGLPPIDLTHVASGADDFSRPSRSSGNANGVPGGLGSGPTDGSAFMEHQVDKPVFLSPGSPTPAYPEMLRSAGLDGGVLVEFVVDTLGRIENGSLKVIQSDHDLFVSSVRSVVPRLRFIPAEARGQKVRQLVRLPFRFDIHF